MKGSNAARTKPKVQVRILIVGRGRLGRSLGRALANAGHLTTLVRGHGSLAIQTTAFDIVFVVVPDPHIEAVMGRLRGDAIRAHCSARMGFGPFGDAPGVVAHPMASFPFVTNDLSKVVWTVAGQHKSKTSVVRILKSLGGEVILTEGQTVKYHAVATLMTSALAKLTEHFENGLVGAVKNVRDRKKLAQSLVASVARNITSKGSLLSGPIARKDYSALAAHLGALVREREILSAYHDVLGWYGVESLAEPKSKRVTRSTGRARTKR